MGEFLVIEQRLHELTTGVCACVTLIHVFEKRKKLDSNKEQVFGYKICETHVRFERIETYTRYGGCVSSPAGCGQRVLATTYLLLRKYLFLKVDGLATRYIVKCRSLHWLLKDCPRFNRFSDPEK